MKHFTINGKAVGAPTSRLVISRSAILILSGVLIGTTVSQGNLTGTSFTGFCAGIVGMISFFALDLAAHGRHRRVLRKKLAAADSTLAKRLTRHVDSQSMRTPSHRRPHVDSSYLPVTPAWR
jgi:hypothetical protein